MTSQFLTARRMALFGAILMGAFSWFSLSIGDEGPEIFGKLLAGWAVGAICGALIAKTLPPAKLPFESNVGFTTVGFLAFGIMFSANLAEVRFVMNEEIGLKGEPRARFLARAEEGCTKKQIGAPENGGAQAAVIVSYCNCSANGMADRVSFNQLSNYVTAGGFPQSLLNTVAENCRSQMLK